MSGLLGLLLVSVSVGLSNFAGAIGIGLTGIDARTRLRVGIAFGLFEALMPIAGLLLGQAVAGYFGHIAKYVAGGILILTGVYTIWSCRLPIAAASRPHTGQDAVSSMKGRGRGSTFISSRRRFFDICSNRSQFIASNQPDLRVATQTSSSVTSRFFNPSGGSTPAVCKRFNSARM